MQSGVLTIKVLLIYLLFETDIYLNSIFPILFEEFKKEASIQTNIKFASDESKAKKMIKKALEKSKSLSGTALKTFLLATIAFISLHCNIAKADVIDLDNSNTLQKISQNMIQNKNTVTSKDFEGSNLNITVNHLSKFMNRQDAKKFKESINNYINKNDISNKKVKQVIYQVMYKTNLRNSIEDALFDSELEDAPIWNENCK